MVSGSEEEKDREILDSLYKTMTQTDEYRALMHVLGMLVENVRSSDVAKDQLTIHAPDLKRRLEKSKRLMYLFKEDSKLQNGEVVTLRKAFVFLGLFETSLTNVVDLILMFFIAIHHDLYNFFAREYAKTLDHLDKISLYEKLLFLNHHGLHIPCCCKQHLPKLFP